jgi:hypothetical protein
MAKQKKTKTAKPKKREPVRVLWINKGDSLKTIYEKAKKAMTAEDIVRFTETEEGIPAREIVAELETWDREARAKAKAKKKNAPKKSAQNKIAQKKKGKPKDGR